MNWNAIAAIAAIAEFLSVLGVLASLVYLGFQIRQNTSWLRQQAFQMGTNELRRWTAHFSDSRAISEIFLKGQRDYASLDRVERFRFTWLVFELCSVWGTYQLYHGEDLLGMRESADVSIRMWITQGWFRDWWKRNGYQLPPVFKDFVVEILEKSELRP